MKKIIVLICMVLLSRVGYTQVNIIVEPRANIAMAAIGIANPGVEFGITPRSAVTLEYLGSFAAHSFLGSGDPFLATVGYLDYRYYTTKKRNLSGFFFGGSFGIGTWKMSRSVLVATYDYPDGSYDVGTSFMMGVSLGYKFLINERWGVEVSTSAGWIHSKHEGYDKYGILHTHMNLSDEFLPFKGGIYLTYRLGTKKK